MIGWKEVIAAQERSKELLREAEQARRTQQASATDADTSVWQRVKGLFSGTTKNETATEEASDPS